MPQYIKEFCANWSMKPAHENLMTKWCQDSDIRAAVGHEKKVSVEEEKSTKKFLSFKLKTWPYFISAGHMLFSAGTGSQR
jgi:hypothetical protein